MAEQLFLDGFPTSPSSDLVQLAAADTPNARKSRGAFFTPPTISRFLADWAIRTARDRLLEPSCGDAEFLLAAANRLRMLGVETPGPGQLTGIELHDASAREAARRTADAGAAAEVITGSFFDQSPTADFDAVIGNPPYIRYQEFSGSARVKSQELALQYGVRLSGLSSSWAAFVVHASRFLKPSGRLGLVLPAELLSVKYAGSVREFLLKRFARVRIVLFEELIFPGVLEEVVLLLAEGEGPATFFEVHQAKDARALESSELEDRWASFIPKQGDKWTPALLSQAAQEFFAGVARSEAFSPLLHWGQTYLGAVTGSNKFFALSEVDVETFRLRDDDVIRISPPGSRHLRGMRYSRRDWESDVAAGAPAFLFWPSDEPMSAAARQYLRRGIDQGVSARYKCRTRTPWWRVPLVRRPDLLMTYMDHERPRLIENKARVHHLNSLYGVELRNELKHLGSELLPLAMLNSVTLLSAELVGRAYGGGLLKLEPTEADQWLVPSPAAIKHVAEQLRARRKEVEEILAGDDRGAAVEIVDEVVLVRGLGIQEHPLAVLREARQQLLSRRLTRGRSSNGTSR